MDNTYAFMERYVRDRSKKLSVHANRLGRLCIAWSSLELDISLLLNSMMHIEDRTVNNTVLGLMGFHEKIKATLAIGFTVKHSDSWYDAITTTLKTVDRELRPERNRMIHDFWLGSIEDGAIKRAQFGPKFIKPKARELKLIQAQYKPVTPDDITALCKKIEQASITITTADYEYKRVTFPKRYPPLTHYPNPSPDRKK